jgi:iron-sulfur cluster repair protein YtfE (RIC family)
VRLEQMVLGASRIGADIAGFVVKRETMDRLLPELRGHDKEFQEIRQQMRDATDNLVRAREGYLQAVHGLQSQPPQQVLSTIDRLQADLEQRNFMQQARVLPVLARQYRELVDGHSADMDRWTTELGQTIERLPDNSPRTPTV